MAINRELSQFAGFVTIDESGNNNVGIATTVRISGGGGLFVGGVEVISPTGVWKGSSSGLIGSQGAQGAVGAQGAQGAVGAQGAQGAVGAQGAQGAQGAVGAQGAQGAVGSQGAQGAVGTQGAQGAVGSQGAQGAVGSQGAQGAVGSQGAQGAVGSQGAQGAVGAQGAQGAVGSQGAQGAGGPSNTVSAQAVTTNSTFYPVFVAGTGNQTPSIRTTSQAFTFNPSTGNLSISGYLVTGGYRYWRYVVGSATNGHHPRTARIILTSSGTGIDTDIAVFTSDNCSDSGTIPSDGTTYSYDFISNIWICAAKIYVSFGGARAANYSVQYSTNNSSWTTYFSGSMSSTGCGFLIGTGSVC